MKNTLHENWVFLSEHKIFNVEHTSKRSDLPEVLQGMTDSDVITSRVSYFERGLDIEVVMVNPETDAMDDCIQKNTQQKVWFETSVPILENGSVILSRDEGLYASGDTFEQAIAQLSEKVKVLYGEDQAGSAVLIDAT